MTNPLLIPEIDRLQGMVSGVVDNPDTWTLAADAGLSVNFRWLSAIHSLLEAQAELRACRATLEMGGEA